jgi:hypothetical protein
MPRYFSDETLERDLAARCLCAASVHAGPQVTMSITGTFSAGDRTRIVFDVRVDDEYLGCAVQWCGADYRGVFPWGLSIPGYCLNFGFASREALLLAVHRFLEIGAVEG